MKTKTEMKGTMAYIFIKVFDLERMVHFYCDTLGFEKSFYKEDECAFLKLKDDPQMKLAFYAGRTMSIQTEPNWFFVINVPDLDKVISFFKENEVLFEELDSVPYGRAIVLNDIENNVIEIHQPDHIN